jgi:exopolysaccharide biosynthesis polyprenyl glycosylphosphotransferase
MDMSAQVQPSTTRWVRLAPGFTSRLNVMVDTALIAGAAFASAAVDGTSPAEVRALVWVACSLVSTWVVVAASLRHYASFAYERGLLDETAMITTQTAAVITVLALLHLIAPAGTVLPPIPLVLPMVWAPTLLFRLILFRRFADREDPVEEVLIVGAGPMGRLTAQDMRQRGRIRVVGHVVLHDETEKDLALLRRTYARDGEPCKVLGGAAGIESVLRDVPVDEVYVAGNVRKHGEEMQEVVRVCEKFGMPFALPAYAFRLERAQAVDAEAISDGYLHYQNNSARPQQIAMKRLFDIAASAAALWVLMPLFTVVMLLIKVTSRGPVFFKQQRMGLRGRNFNMLKFRSMVMNAEALKDSLTAVNEQSGPVFKMRNDPRVTRVGRFIRKYSIDELPQLINVLRGDMSIVGPRPPVPGEVEKYEAWQRRRLSVRPGLTCIWQVSGRNQISFEEWMYLDMQYIDHWSLARDFNLIFRTVPVVITGRGAS